MGNKYIDISQLNMKQRQVKENKLSRFQCFKISFLKNQMSIERWMEKEDVAHTYNGILLSHKNKQNWVICNEVDGPRVCHTEWSKSEREKQIPYANTYICNLKKKCFWRT